MSGEPDPAYVRARLVLLDALEALQAHLDSVILVGAQAVYLHTGEAEFAVAPFTTDADLALDAESLRDEPRIEAAMEAAGFTATNQPGAWLGREGVSVDLMVAETQSGRGTRAASIPPHDRRTARRARGLEGALIDKDRHRVAALSGEDARSFEIHVAGPAALVVAKSIKIDERKDHANRLSDKDALDVLRLLRATDSQEVAERMLRIEADARARDVVARAMELLSSLFGTPQSTGCEMVARAVAGLEDEAEIAASLSALAAELASAVAHARGGRP